MHGSKLSICYSFGMLTVGGYPKNRIGSPNRKTDRAVNTFRRSNNAEGD
jgi:hypothetical protein